MDSDSKKMIIEDESLTVGAVFSAKLRRDAEEASPVRVAPLFTAAISGLAISVASACGILGTTARNHTDD